MTKKRAQMADVARLSGLSRSTVDRVLNGRPGVRAETVKKVEDAMRELGYAPSALLNHRAVAGQTVASILSDGSNPFFDRIQRGFAEAQRQPQFEGVDYVNLTFDPYNPETLLTAISQVPDEATAVIVVGVETPEAVRAVNDLVNSGKTVITLISDMPLSKRLSYVGQDNFAAGRTAARLLASMIPPGEGQVALLLGHLQFRHLLDRMSGFRQVMGLVRPELTLLQPPAYGADSKTIQSIITQLELAGPDLCGAYVAGGGQPQLIAAMSESNFDHVKVIGHEVNDDSRRALNAGHFSALLAVDVVGMCAKAIGVAVGQRPADQRTCAINIYVPDNLPD